MSRTVKKVCWRDVPGWEGLYQASSTGQIRTCPRPGTRIRKYKKLKPTKNRRGHLRVVLRANGKDVLYGYVHKIVASTFIGPTPPDMFVLHRDDDKRNNHPKNLYHGTRIDNARDALRNGCHGTESHRRKRRKG
jgi:hypothetical protein